MRNMDNLDNRDEKGTEKDIEVWRKEQYHTTNTNPRAQVRAKCIHNINYKMGSAPGSIY